MALLIKQGLKRDEVEVTVRRDQQLRGLADQMPNRLHDSRVKPPGAFTHVALERVPQGLAELHDGLLNRRGVTEISSLRRPDRANHVNSVMSGPITGAGAYRAWVERPVSNEFQQ